MKIILIAFLIFSNLKSIAQQIRPYLAVIKTNSGTIKGVLYKVDSAYLAVDGQNGFVTIDSREIESIKIRVPKKGCKIGSF